MAVHGSQKMILSDYRTIAIKPGSNKNTIRAIDRTTKIAAKFDILNSEYPNILAKTATLQTNYSDAGRYTERALRLDPLNSRHLADAANVMYQQGNHDQAEHFFKQSILCDKNDMAAYIRYAAMLFEIKKPEKSFQVMKEAISMNPQITRSCLTLMVLHKIDEDRMHLALPDRVEPYLVLGDFFDSLGNMQKAEKRLFKSAGICFQ